MTEPTSRSRTPSPGPIAFAEGDNLPDVTIVPDRTNFVRFAGAAGDFNPVHHDELHARRLGNPSVFAMGMWTASVASRTITDAFGLASLRHFSVRFLAPVWPDQPLHFRTRVESVRLAQTTNVYDLSLRIEGQGEIKMVGKATVEVSCMV